MPVLFAIPQAALPESGLSVSRLCCSTYVLRSSQPLTTQKRLQVFPDERRGWEAAAAEADLQTELTRVWCVRLTWPIAVLHRSRDTSVGPETRDDHLSDGSGYPGLPLSCLL
jgi:hypothetical protein